MPTLKETTNKLVFIDTDFFVDLFVQSAEKLLDDIISTLDKNEIILLLSEVNIREIQVKIEKITDEWLENIENGLSAGKILGKVPDGQVKEDKPKSKNKIALSLNQKYFEILELNKGEILKKICQINQDFYKNIDKILTHKNTKVISLNDEILLKGIKRSVLRRSPYTKLSTEKRENAHTKDSDCIIFESLVFYLNNNYKKEGTKLILCISDKDYYDKKGDLEKDIMDDLKDWEIVSYKNLFDMFNIEFKKQISKPQIKTEIISSSGLSLEGPTGLASSDKI